MLDEMLDDADELQSVLRAAAAALPMPKPKTKPKAKATERVKPRRWGRETSFPSEAPITFPGCWLVDQPGSRYKWKLTYNSKRLSAMVIRPCSN